MWEASDRLCSKRLKPLIPILLPAVERHGRLDLDVELRDKLPTISAATMDRLLSEVRAVARGGQRRRAGMSSAVRRSVPVRTFGDWNDPPPGYVEVDCVAHSGTSSSGSFVQTTVLTDIATGWTECVPVRTPESGRVIAATVHAHIRSNNIPTTASAGQRTARALRWQTCRRNMRHNGTKGSADAIQQKGTSKTPQIHRFG
ncbi:hypothetical protein [Sinorhizobium meliloti]|uniref:hypothetical protein n=1 Tax=Rhizobium meliloti TaxID=382 RepID=UPI00398A08F2